MSTTFEFILSKETNLVFTNHKSTNKSPNTIILGKQSAYHWHSKTHFNQCWSHINNSEAREGIEVPLSSRSKMTLCVFSPEAQFVCEVFLKKCIM